MLQHKGLQVRLCGRSPRAPCPTDQQYSHGQGIHPQDRVFPAALYSIAAAKSCRCNMRLECPQSW